MAMLVDADELRALATELQVRAHLVDSEINQALERHAELSTMWSGGAQSAAASYVDNIQEHKAELRTALSSLAQLLDSAADAYEQTDEALRLALETE